MTNTYNFQMTQEKLYNRLKFKIGRENRKYKYDALLLSDKLYIGQGSSIMDFSHPIESRIGILLKLDDIKNMKGDILSDKTVAEAFVSLFHEIQHVKQQVHPSNADISASCILANYEDQYNYPYSNYFHMPHEIDAEYTGIIDTYDYLSVLFDEKSAEKAICEYVDWKAHGHIFNKNDLYFIDLPIYKHVKSIDVIEDMFNDAFAKGFNEICYYDPSIPGSIKSSFLDNKTMQNFLIDDDIHTHMYKLVAIEDFLHPGAISDGIGDPDIVKELQRVRFEHRTDNLFLFTETIRNKSHIDLSRKETKMRGNLEKSSREIPDISHEADIQNEDDMNFT